MDGSDVDGWHLLMPWLILLLARQTQVYDKTSVGFDLASPRLRLDVIEAEKKQRHNHEQKNKGWRRHLAIIS